MRERGLHLGVALLADDDHLVALVGEATGSQVDLLHEGAGGVKDLAAERAGAGLLVGGDAVGAQQQRATGGLLGAFHDGDPAGGKAVHNARVVDEGAKGVDGTRGLVGRVLDHLEGALHAVAGTRLGGNDDA